MSAEDRKLDPGRPRQRRFGRRGALVGLGVIGAGLLGLRSRTPAGELRPPGAAAGREFTRRCIRCLRCAVVCPVQAVRFDSDLGLLGSDTPYVRARDQACVLCMKCTEACPTGALERISANPEIVRTQVRMGRPELRREHCLAWNGGGECRACYFVCPYPDSAVRLEPGLLAPLFDPDACVGCGLCEEACPDRARAIRIVPASSRR